MAELCRHYAPAKKEAELCRLYAAARPKCSWRARFERRVEAAP